MSGDTGSTSSAPVRAAPRSSSSPVSASRRRTGRGSRRPSQPRPRSACTTVPVTDEATRQDPRTGSHWRPTSTPCSSGRAWPGRTSSSGIRRVDRTSGCSRRPIRTRSRAWSCSTPSRPTRSPRCPTTLPTTRRSGWSTGWERRWPASASLGPSSDCRPTSRPSRPLAAHTMSSSPCPLPCNRLRRLRASAPRPLIVVTALSGAQTGWSAAQDRMVALSTNATHVVLATATHTSIISGDDSPVSSQAILDVVASIRSGTALR